MDKNFEYIAIMLKEKQKRKDENIQVNYLDNNWLQIIYAFPSKPTFYLFLKFKLNWKSTSVDIKVKTASFCNFLNFAKMWIQAAYDTKTAKMEYFKYRWDTHWLKSLTKWTELVSFLLHSCSWDESNNEKRARQSKGRQCLSR